MNLRGYVFCSLCLLAALGSWFRPSPAPAESRSNDPSYGDLHVAIVCMPLPIGPNASYLNFNEVLPGFSGKRVVNVSNGLTPPRVQGDCNPASGFSLTQPTETGFFTTVFYQDQ